MYQPAVPRIPLSPAFRAAQLAEIELGRLLLLRATSDGTAGPSLALRADALSAQGELTAGALRLRPLRFERLAPEESVIAVEVDYLLEPDLASMSARLPASGDLLLAARRPGAAGLYVAAVFAGNGGLLDTACATIRPFGAAPRAGAQVALNWRLLERSGRARVLFERCAPEPQLQELPRRVHAEDCD